jgi:ribosome maturation factor RimP
MYRQNMTLVKLLDPVVQAMGYEMLGIEHIPNGQGSTLRIYIDNEQGIKLEDCSRVSQQIAGVLDVNDPIQGTYDLEVSSPGFDRPLFTVEHFRRYIGAEVKLNLREKIAGRRKLVGEIIAVSDESVEVIDMGINYKISVDVIDKARLVS